MVAISTLADEVLRLLLPVEHELLVFAAFWFAIGLIDELAIDLVWLWMRLTERVRTHVLPRGFGRQPLKGKAAVLIPAFQEAEVIATTVRHMLSAWPHNALRLYVGCYANDPATLAAAMEGAAGDPRVRLVVHGAQGPTTKADCLNRLYQALCSEEERSGEACRMILLHDAEDMVHPAALAALDQAMERHDFAQLPVRPTLSPASRWIAGHYADEFAESHAKAMVVRSALGAAIPAAGVGCAFSRAAMARLAAYRAQEGEAGPFAPECLTEDYELGLMLSQEGRGSTFLRMRDTAGALVATGSYFPGELTAAVRQKTRWVHGIAFQGWERMGWSGRPLDLWMALRDRRGPLTALVLFAAYLLLVIDGVLFAAKAAGLHSGLALSPLLTWLLGFSFAGFLWRAVMRGAFTAREYGWREGLIAVLRIPVSNVIAIMAGRRALVAYLRSLVSGRVTWDKTAHQAHPATPLLEVRT